MWWIHWYLLQTFHWNWSSRLSSNDPYTSRQHQALISKATYLTIQTPCLAQEGPHLEKAGIISPQPQTLFLPSFLFQEKGPIHTWGHLQDGNRLQENEWAAHILALHTDENKIFQKPHSRKLFFKLDARSGYYNITVAEDIWKYTAFTNEYGKYEFPCVLFGKPVTPSYFTRVINETLKGLDFCFAFLDNIIIYSKTEKPGPNETGIYPPTQRKPQIKIDKMWLFKIPNTPPWTFILTRRNIPLTRKLDAIKAMILPKIVKSSVLRTNRPLQKPYQSLCWQHPYTDTS